MKMYGVFAIVVEDVGSPVKSSYDVALAESDKNPMALCRYADTAQTIVKGMANGGFEVREVDVPTFEVIVRRAVAL